ncbi:MAG: GGDEF domain-containing protein [Patescibacteria group bacterium]
MKFSFGSPDKKPDKSIDALEELRLSREAGNVAGLAEDHIKYLEEQHETEGLTGLKTRKVFDRELEAALGLLSGKIQERRAHAEAPKVVSVIMVDLDDFKKINDTRGHAVGDAVLRSVAEVISECVRASDTAARYGGEELVVLMPGATAKVAAQHAEDIRARIEQLTFDQYPDLRVTGSLGIAEVTEVHENDESDVLVKNADRAMYEAKANGKNRVEIYQGGR